MEIHKFPYNWKLAEANFTKRQKARCFLVLRVVAVQLWATSWQGLM